MAGAGGIDVGTPVVEQRADAAPFGASHHDVAHLERTAIDQHGCHRTTALVELGFDDDAFGGTIGIGPEFQHFRLQQDDLQQLVEVGLGLGGHFHFERVATHRFHLNLMAQQFGAHTLRVGVGLVDLVDGDDDRHTGCLGMADGFDRLRHDAVVGRHHQNDDVGHLGAAGTHRREGGMARGVDEGDLLALLLDLIGADMLGDATGLAGHHVGVAQSIEQ